MGERWKMSTAADTSNASRQLILMRHAKSDWADESLSDHDRPLNKRGRRDAPRVGHWLAEEDFLPDRILVSSSERTKETIALMIDAWQVDPETIFDDALYHASLGEILGAIQSNGGDSRRLMVLAHNPGMTSLVSHFAGDFMEMPTAAIGIFETACDSWTALHPGTSTRLLDFMRPKQLGPDQIGPNQMGSED
jgi:phosphohistidine phosphatase